jgi:branched-chain amino acid transport system permease protein
MNERNIGGEILKVENISLSFGIMKVLDDISFDIRQGEIRSIIGPNGAGKSSMLNVINGFYHPQQGSITFKGETRKQMAPHVAASGGIARTFQNIALFKGMSTLDNIMTGRNLKMKTNLFWQALHIGPARAEELENREAAERIIDFLDIQAIRKKPVGKLPYGLQKRVELGRALAAEPELLLLDEPMAGMNSEEKEDMCRFVLDVNAEFGTTIALIEHDMGVVMDLSDRVLVLDYGKQLADGLPDEVRNNQTVIDGIMYSLVALGFVLIFKASGIFNFAQGVMALFAALTLVGLMEKFSMPIWLAIIGTIAVMVALAWAIERFMLRPLVNQEPIILFMATIGLAYVLEGMGDILWGSDVKMLDIGIPQGASDWMLDSFDIYIEKLEIFAAATAAVMVTFLAIFFQKTRIGRALRAVADDHQAALSVGISLNTIWVIVWSVAGIVALVAGIMWGSKSGVQFSLSLIALKALPVLILGGFTSVPGAIIGGMIIGVGEKVAEVYLGPIVGGAIENWFAYMLALAFLLFRPQGLFGERIIERV